jgi:predicted nucleic acid-binding protein
MTYLIDSDWVADALKGRPNATSLLASLSPSGIGISTITFGEVYEGIYYGSQPKHYERVFYQFLRGVTVLSVTRGVAKRSPSFAGTCDSRASFFRSLIS